MPITINYAANPFSQSDEQAYLKEPVFAKNELRFEKLSLDKPGFKRAARHFQFYTGYKQNVQEWGDIVKQTHNWMNDNINGPWMLLDNWVNHGHSYGCRLHIERFDQRDFFQAAEFGKYFNRQTITSSDPETEITDLAIIKGIVPPYSEKEDFDTWLSMNRGYNINYSDKEGEKIYVFNSSRPELTKSFVEEFVKQGIFKPDNKDDFICSYKTFDENQEKITKWARANAAFKTDTELKEKLIHIVQFNHAATENLFKESWGSKFIQDPETGIYKGSDLKLPVRDIPKEFVDYLYGRAPDPSLKFHLST